MKSEKEEIIAAAKALPDDRSWDDGVYDLYFLSKLKKSTENFKNGNVMTLKELRKHIDELEGKYANNITK